MKKYILDVNKNELLNTKTNRPVATTASGKFRLRVSGEEKRLTVTDILSSLGLYSDLIEIKEDAPETKEEIKEAKESTKPYFINSEGLLCSRKTRKEIAKTSSGKYRVRYDGRPHTITIESALAGECDTIVENIGTKSDVTKEIVEAEIVEAEIVEDAGLNDDVVVQEAVKIVNSVNLEPKKEEVVEASNKDMGISDSDYRVSGIKNIRMSNGAMYSEQDVVTMISQRRQHTRSEIVAQMPKLRWLLEFLGDLDLTAYKNSYQVKHDTMKFLIQCSKYAHDQKGTCLAIRMLNDSTENIVLDKVEAELRL